MKLLLLLLLPFPVYCQSYGVSNRGTYIVSAITKDGIVVGADSRACNIEKGRVYAFCDSTQKIFSYQSIFLQASGLYDYSFYTMYGLFNKFKNENHENVNAANFFRLFSSFCKNIVTKDDFAAFNTQARFIVSGYVGSMPCIYYYTNNKVDSCIGNGIQTNIDKDNISISYLRMQDTISIDAARKWITRTIHNVSMGYSNKTNTFPIVGGPTSTGYIKKDGSKYEDFQTSYSYDTVEEEMTANYSDKTRKFYRSQQDSVHYKKALRKDMLTKFNVRL